jgi:hypothetical protein
LKDVFAPSLLAIPTEKENAMQLLEQEEKSRAARRRSVSFITSIVSRFFEESAEGTEKKSILPDFISRFIPQRKRPEKEERIATKSPALPARDEKSNLPMAEAAKAIADHCGERILYINVANRLSVDCDCNSDPEEPRMGDIGILSSLDPVALDRASTDLVRNSTDPGKEHLIERIDSRHGMHTLDWAEKLGMGSQSYELIEI